jgi:hypothetical protein
MENNDAPAPKVGLLDRLNQIFDEAPAPEPADATPPVVPEPTDEQTPAAPADKKEAPKKADETGEVSEDAPEISTEAFLELDEDALVLIEDDEIPEFVKSQGEEGIKTWKGLKDAKRAAEKEAAELKAEVAKLKGEGDPQEREQVVKEMEQLRKRVAEQEKVIAATRVEESEDYQKAVREPIGAIESEITKLVGTPEIIKEIFDTMLDTDTKRRAEGLSEAVDGLTDYARYRIYELVREYDNVLAKEQEIRRNAVQVKAELDMQALERNAQETEQQKARREAALGKVWENALKTLPFMADEETGEVLPEYVDVLGKAKGVDIARAGLATQAFAPIAIHLVPKLAGMLKQRDSEVAGLKNQIERLTGSRPHTRNPTNTPKAEVQKPLGRGGLVDEINARFEAAGIGR